RRGVPGRPSSHPRTPKVNHEIRRRLECPEHPPGMYGAIAGYRALRSAQPPSAVRRPRGALVCLLIMLAWTILVTVRSAGWGSEVRHGWARPRSRPVTGWWEGPARLGVAPVHHCA